MKLSLGILLCLVGFIRAVSVANSELESRAFGEADCGVTKLQPANVYCVSKTQFVPGFFQDAASGTILNCPEGTFCVNAVNFCSSTGTPVCSNEVPGADGACNTCSATAVNDVVCISKTEYGFCSNGQVTSGMAYSCPPAEPYCRASYGPDVNNVDVLQKICTADATATDCINEATTASTGSTTASTASSGSTGSGGSTESTGQTGSTPRTTASPATTCQTDGFFANPGDTSCQSYVRCYGPAAGTISWCLAGYSFNNATKRCVPSSTYTCPP